MLTNENAIRSSYEHPWHKIQRKIELILEKRKLRDGLLDDKGFVNQGKRSSRIETEDVRHNNFDDSSQNIIIYKSALEVPSN